MDTSAMRQTTLPILPSTWPGRELIWLRDSSPGLQRQFIEATLQDTSPANLRRVQRLWEMKARRDQLPPDRALNGEPWSQWLVMGGRGAGKTRTGAEWVRACVFGDYGFSRIPMGRIALVGETMADVRDVMIEGVSGLLRIHSRWDRPTWESSRRRLV